MAVNTISPRRNIANSDVTRFLSPNIWADFPVAECIEDPTIGIFRFEDWRDLPLAPALTTQIGFGKYKAFATTGCTISKVSPINSVEVQGGALALTTDTDNDSASIADAYPSFLLSGLTSNSGRLCWEICIAQKSVATNMAASFVGLAEVEQWTLATAVPFNGGDAITNAAAAIGFRIEEDGLGVIDTVYSDRATSFTNIGDTEGGTLTAFGFKKLGLVYDPTKTGTVASVPTECCIRFVADNINLATGMTKSTLTGLTNLDANALGFIAATCADSAGTAHEFYIKWMAVGQLF